MNQKDEAIDCYKKAILLDDKQVIAYIALGNIYFDNQNYSTAMMYLDKAYSINPNAEDIKLYLSLVYYKLGDFEKSKSLLKQACIENENISLVILFFLHIANR